MTQQLHLLKSKSRKWTQSSFGILNDDIITSSSFSDHPQLQQQPNSNHNFFGSTDQVLEVNQIVPNFLSKHVRRYLDDLNPTTTLQPSATERFAAVVMADVSGYSALTATLAERGSVGAELLSKTMKGYLDKIIQIILIHGGDIVKFAGDAVIFYWKLPDPIDPNDHNDDNSNSNNNNERARLRGEIVYKAANCCLELLTKLGTYNIDIPDCPTKTLRIHLGIGAGNIFDVQVGGFPGRWEHFIAGDAVKQLATVLDLAKAGELAMSHAALRWFQNVIDINSLTLGGYGKKCIILQGLERAQRKVPPPPSETGDEKDLWEILPANSNVELYKLFVNQSAIFKLQADINQSKVFESNAGLADLLSLYELRQVTTIFIKIASLPTDSEDTLIKYAQEAMTVVQTAMKKYQGSLRQFHVDDKGAVILCFFGLPPMAHENDPALGVKAALEINKEFENIFDNYSMGVTTGVISIGGVGNAVRTEYALMGDSINMAARLMCLPEAQNSLLCDEKTYNLCQFEFTFDNVGMRTVKGKSTKIRVFKPVSFDVNNNNTERIVLEESEDAENTPDEELVGRDAEKQVIVTALDNNGETNQSVIMIEGEDGQGLTSLTKFLKHEANKRQSLICSSAGMELEKDTWLYIYRNILHDLFNILESAESTDAGELLIRNINQLNERSFQQTESRLEGDEETKPTHNIGLHKLLASTDAIHLLASSPNNPESPSDERIHKLLAKINESPDATQLLDLIYATNSQQQEPSSISNSMTSLQNPKKSQTKELTELLKRMLNTISLHCDITLVLSEMQWADRKSWDLTFELIQGCPNITVFLFSRPESNYEDLQSLNTYTKVKNWSHTVFRRVEGLSIDATRDLIIRFWNTPDVLQTVSPTIVESIYKRAGGNPMFTKSLVIALKESGQCRIVDGELAQHDNRVDLDDVIPGFDLQSIIVSQFDRLDRNFQLLLKIAAVLGSRFLFDDIVYFLSNLSGWSEYRDRPQALLRTIQSLDKYGFLRKVDGVLDGVYIQFKSVIVRKCIYNMMVVAQRQRLHLRIATYYESALTESNRHRLLYLLYDHYMETDKSHNLKKLRYLEAVSHLYHEKRVYPESIKHYLLLLSKVDDLQRLTGLQLYDRVTIATWMRELGESYLAMNEFDKAERYLLDSLGIVERPFPKGPLLTTYYTMRKRMTLAQRNKTLHSSMKKPNAITASRQDKHQEVYQPETPHLFNLLRDCRVSLLQNVRVTFWSLAQIYMKTERWLELQYSIYAALKICERFVPHDYLYPRFLALAGLTSWVLEKRQAMSIRYLDAAERFANSSGTGGNIAKRPVDSETIAVVHSCSVAVYFMLGMWTDFQSSADTLKIAGEVLNDATRVEESLRMKTIVCSLRDDPFARNVAPEQSLLQSRVEELRKFGSKEDNWKAQFWGSALNLKIILENDEIDISDLRKSYTELKEVFINGNFADKLSPPVLLTYLGIITMCDIKLSQAVDFAQVFKEAETPLKELDVGQWSAVFGIFQIVKCLFTAYDSSLLADRRVIRATSSFLDTLVESLKSLDFVCISEPLIQLIQGFRKALGDKSNNGKAGVKIWKAALNMEKVQEMGEVKRAFMDRIARAEN